jgi:phage terminase large subunit-like protein
VHRGQPFRLTAWQRRDIIAPIFGTVLPDGRRQYRTAFIEIGRKNGKSQLAAGIALVMLFLDDEPGAEVLCLASDVDQARVVYGECKRMVEASPEIQDAFKPIVYRDSIEYAETGSVLRVLSADEKGIHGRNPSALILDELHTFRTPKQREFFAGATTAMGTRRNPLSVLITTAGWDRDSLCYELHEYAAAVRAGIRDDPSFLSVFYGAPPEADWRDPAVWRQANPALSGPDAFLSLEYLQTECRQAEALPARQAVFRQLYLNQWTSSDNPAIDLTRWDANHAHAIDEATYRGSVAYGALDLAAVSDLTALVYLFPCPHDPQALDVVARFFVPEAALARGRDNADLYQPWATAGLLTVTPGDSADYHFVRAAVLQDARAFDVRSFAIDRLFQGQQLASELLEEGLPVVAMGQGHMAFAVPMVEFFRRLTAKQIHHGAHPILRWMASNLVVKVDPAGNMKPDKARSRSKIDGVVALVMALDGVTRFQPKPEPKFQMLILSAPRDGWHPIGRRP